MTRRRLRFTTLVPEPVIYQLVKDFDIVVNIQRAEVRAEPGRVVLELDGDEERVTRGMTWLKEQGVRVDPIEHDLIS